jgi:hypothetical protein
MLLHINHPTIADLLITMAAMCITIRDLAIISKHHIIGIIRIINLVLIITPAITNLSLLITSPTHLTGIEQVTKTKSNQVRAQIIRGSIRILKISTFH